MTFFMRPGQRAKLMAWSGLWGGFGEGKRREKGNCSQRRGTGDGMGLLGRAGFEVLGVVDEDGRDMAIGAFGYGVYVLRPGD